MPGPSKKPESPKPETPWYMKKQKVASPAEGPAVIEIPPAPPEAPTAEVTTEPEAVVPQSKRCTKCGRKWSPPVPDVCPECGSETKEE